jgi:hypothetical protein
MNTSTHLNIIINNSVKEDRNKGGRYIYIYAKTIVQEQNEQTEKCINTKRNSNLQACIVWFSPGYPR